MKRQLLVFAAIAAAVTVLVPLTATAQVWDLNLYGGWSYSTLTGGGTVLSDGQYQSGFGGGVGAELRLNEDWGWEFGLWYVQKGTQGTFTRGPVNPVEPPDSGDTFQGSFDLDYVEVPILVNVYFPVGDNADIRAYIGPTFSFLTSAKASGNSGGQPVDQDVSSTFDDADITFMIGAGGQWHLSRVNFLLDFRWDIGATNISNTPETELRNNTILITAGISIPLASGAE